MQQPRSGPPRGGSRGCGPVCRSQHDMRPRGLASPALHDHGGASDPVGSSAVTAVHAGLWLPRSRFIPGRTPGRGSGRGTSSRSSGSDCGLRRHLRQLAGCTVDLTLHRVAQAIRRSGTRPSWSSSSGKRCWRPRPSAPSKVQPWTRSWRPISFNVHSASVRRRRR